MLRSITGLTLGVRRLAVSSTRGPLVASSSSSRIIPAASPLARGRPLHTSSPRSDIATGAEDAATSEKLVTKAKKASSTAGTAKAGAKKSAIKKTAGAAAKKVTPKKKAAPKKKAPPKPKRVLNPPKPINSTWVLYFKQKLDALPAEDKKNVIELSQRYAAEFRNLSSEERAKYDRQLEEHKKQYEADLAAWKETITPEMIQAENEYRRQQRKVSKKKQNPRLLRDPTKPQMPLNAYVRWCNQVRNDPNLRLEILEIRELTEVSAVDQVKKLARAWKEMGEDDKRPFVEAYQKDRAQYDAAIEEWKAAQQQPAL